MAAQGYRPAARAAAAAALAIRSVRETSFARADEGAAAEGGDPGGEILEAFQDRFRAYRKNWRGQPQAAIERQLTGAAFAENAFSFAGRRHSGSTRSSCMIASFS